MSAVATPRSAARAGSGTISSSGRSSEADEEMLPRPFSATQVALHGGRQRRTGSPGHRRTAPAASASPGSLLMKLIFAPGRSASKARTSRSSCFWSRSRSWLRAPIQHQRGLARFADTGLARVADVQHAADHREHLFQLRQRFQTTCAPVLGHRQCVLDARTRRQFDAEVAAAEVGERDEGRRDQRHQRQRRDEQHRARPTACARDGAAKPPPSRDSAASSASRVSSCCSLGFAAGRPPSSA